MERDNYFFLYVHAYIYTYILHIFCTYICTYICGIYYVAKTQIGNTRKSQGWNTEKGKNILSNNIVQAKQMLSKKKTEEVKLYP